MALRFPIAVLLGIAATFALFWVMQALISVSGKLAESRPPPSVDFVRLRKDTTPPTKEREPPRREKPQQQPPPPEMNVAKSMNPSEAVQDVVPIVNTAAEIQEATSLGAATNDTDVVPLVRVDPEYPPRALQRGIEGHVDIEFTIGPAGTVENPKVLASVPPSIFDQSAIRAVRRWRYNPKIEKGVPVSRPGVKVRLVFKLPKGR